MKKTLNLLLILALGTGMLTMSSCTEENDKPDDPKPTEKVCYLTQVTEDGYTTDYKYDTDNNVVSSISKDGSTIDTTTFEYSGGRLSLAYDGDIEATFVYTSGNLPSRINLKEDGIDAGYIIMESTGGNFTKIEIHDEDDVITEVTFMTYDASGNPTSVQIDERDEDTDELVTFLNVQDIVTDGKKNPFSNSMALMYENIDGGMFAYGSSNVLTANVLIGDQTFPLTVTHTYNGNSYPTKSSAVMFGSTTVSDFVYNCK